MKLRLVGAADKIAHGGHGFVGYHRDVSRHIDRADKARWAI